MSRLFEELRLRGVTLRNRIGVAPMCQYRATDGVPNEWHQVHLVSRAIGGNGVVIAEATAVTPEGRISPGCLGLYDDAQAEAFAPIVEQVAEHGAIPAVQIGHAGRKASTAIPWEGRGVLAPEDGGWPVVGPSPVPFAPGDPLPEELSVAGIAALIRAFRDAADRARGVGVRFLELHAAHGYLLHSFHSPLSNRREDAYGGGLAGRVRITREVARAVREVWPDELPLAVRISASDWLEGGWTIEESVQLAAWLREDGVDLIDCSSGGTAPDAPIPAEPGYQVPFAARIRRETGVATAAVGLITEPQQAEDIVGAGEADLVLLARASLRDPYWPRHAATVLGAADRLDVPVSYARGWR